jgi:hypothetical protein
MKNIFKITIILLSISFMAFKTYRAKLLPQTSVTKLNTKDIVVIKTEPSSPRLLIKTNSHSHFLEAIGFKESGNRYDVVNRFGYMGKYQFGKRKLRGLGFKISKEEFLNSPEIQEEAMHKLLQTNKKYLKKYIDEYDGKIVHRVLVTESGLLAAAHLGGAGSVKKWFRTGKVRKDGNGVKITTYMERFSGYELYL